jgi:hypothetical protein
MRVASAHRSCYEAEYKTGKYGYWQVMRLFHERTAEHRDYAQASSNLGNEQRFGHYFVGSFKIAKEVERIGAVKSFTGISKTV